MVVVFESRGEGIERLALGVAVGAVQGRANIRLRCLHNTANDMEYVAPRDADAEWADAIVAVTTADSAANGLARYIDSLAALREGGRPEGKVGAVFTEGTGAASLHAAMNRAGLTTIELLPGPDAPAAARLQGRRVADAARSLRGGRGA